MYIYISNKNIKFKETNQSVNFEEISKTKVIKKMKKKYTQYTTLHRYWCYIKLKNKTVASHFKCYLNKLKCCNLKKKRYFVL